MSACIFCQIIAGQSPAQMVYQDEQISAFHDIHPAAPVHVLVVPNKHIASVNELEASDEALIGRLFSTAKLIAVQEGIDRSGYRLITNTGAHGGQVVYHLHLHLLGGRRMQYPLG